MLTAVAVGDVYGALQGIALQAAAPGVLANDASTAGQPLAVTSFTQPAHGLLVLNTDGSFGYTPTPAYAGADSFTYTASDGTGASTATVALAVAAGSPTATVFVGPRLAAVGPAQGPLLNAVLGGLLGTGLDLSAASWTALANARVGAPALIGHLEADLGLSGPAQVLAANITPAQLFTAAADAATDAGDVAQAAALGALAAQAGPATGTIQLGGLLQGTLDVGDLAGVGFNTLDLVTGAVQLDNFGDATGPPTPIAISGADLAALGMPAAVGGLNLYARVVEPPIFTAGPAGTQFHTAALRLEFDLNNIVGQDLDTSAFLASMADALGLPLDFVSAAASVEDVKVYVEVAAASGSIQMIDAVSRAVAIQATPSLSNVYVGNMAPAFFDRTHAVDPAADLAFGDVASLVLSAFGTENVSSQIAIRDVVLGVAPAGPSSLAFASPYPASAQPIGSGAAALANLSAGLVANLQLEIDGSIGPRLDPVVATLQADLVAPVIAGVVTPILGPLLGGVADPMLNTLGIGLGESVIDVDGLGTTFPAVANADFATAGQATPIVLPVLANDAAPPAATMTIIATTAPADGSIVVNAGGTITYTPVAGFVGTDAFSYTITDGFGTPSTAIVTVIVTDVAAPTAVDDAYLVASGTTLVIGEPGVRANDTDPGGLALSATVVTQPGNGTVALAADGSFTYTPTPGFVGTDTFTYEDVGADASSNVATVTMIVTPPVLTPTAADDAYTVASGAALVVAAPGVRGNDADPGGLFLAATVVAAPANGALALAADGSFTYTPTAGFVGTDTFTYEDSGDGAASNVATVTIVVTAAVPAATAGDDAYTVLTGTALVVAAPGVRANDVNPAGLDLAATVVGGPANGVLALNADGSFTYTPTAGFVGTDIFSYQDAGAGVASNVATVTVIVSAPAPTAADDAYAVVTGTALAVAAPGVRANDADPGGQVLASAVVAGPGHGVLALAADGSFTYTPVAGFVGTDTFTYEDAGGGAVSNVATVTIVVTAAVPSATAADDAYTVVSGAALVVAAPGVRANDVNPGGQSLVVIVVTQPEHGAVALAADGSFIYRPTAGFVGTDTFTYDEVGDGFISNVATVTIVVSAPAPTAADDAYTMVTGTALAVAAPGVRGNDAAPGGQSLAATVVAGPGSGVLALNADGSFTYTPVAGFVGTDAFTYVDAGAGVASNVAIVTIIVTAANATPAAPTAASDAYTTTAGKALAVPVIGLLANDTNPGGGAIGTLIGTLPTHGLVALGPDGSFTYTPTAGYVGLDSFTYYDVGLGGSSNLATVTIVVAAASGSPSAGDGSSLAAVDDAYSAVSGTSLTVPAAGVLANDADPGGLLLTAAVVAQPAHGTLALNADGSFTYVPTAGFTGTDSFTYEDSGGGATSNVATVLLLVAAAGGASTAPVAANDAYTTAPGVTLTVPAAGVLANDANSGGGTIVPVLATSPTHGAVTLNTDGSFTYVPTAGYTGADSFSYYDVGPGGSSNVATVAFNVTSAFVGPAVLNIERLGYHQAPTTVIIAFSAALDPTSAQNVANYRITGPGGHQIDVTSAAYDPSTNDVTLLFASQLNLHLRYTLTVFGAGAGAVIGATGLGLNATTAGQAGTNSTATIDAANLIVPNAFGAGATAALRLAARVRALDARSLAASKLHSQILARAQLHAAAKVHATAAHAAAKVHATAVHAAAKAHAVHPKR